MKLTQYKVESTIKHTLELVEFKPDLKLKEYISIHDAPFLIVLTFNNDAGELEHIKTDIDSLFDFFITDIQFEIFKLVQIEVAKILAEHSK